MSWLESAAAGVASAVVGVVTAGVVAYAAFHWYPFTGVEGALVWFVSLSALVGGLIGFLIGVLASLALKAWAPPKIARRGPALAAIAVAAIAAVTAISLWLLADIPPEIQGQRLNLEVELRLPSGEVTPPVEIANPVFTLYSMDDRVKRKERKGVLKVGDARRENDRWIIPASVFLFTSRGGRLVEAQLGGELIGSFTVPLAGSPGSESGQWSTWWPRGSGPGAPAAAKVAAPDKTAQAPPPPSKGAPPPTKAGTSKGAAPAGPIDVTSFRYRVVRIGPGGQPPPAEPAKKSPQFPVVQSEQATFEAMKPDAPIADWFPYTRLGAPDERRAVAVRNIAAKPKFDEELSGLMVADDNQKASEALFLVARLPVTAHTRTLAVGVAAAGQDIAARLDQLNAATLDAKQTSAAALDIVIRFSAWMDAVRVLRRSTGVNLIPDLVAILERSRVRTDVPTIQQEVRRVASRFAKEWGGVAPAPGDPPW